MSAFEWAVIAVGVLLVVGKVAVAVYAITHPGADL